MGTRDKGMMHVEKGKDLKEAPEMRKRLSSAHKAAAQAALVRRLHRLGVAVCALAVFLLIFGR